MATIRKISSFNVVTIVDGELLIDGVSAGLPTIEDLTKKQNEIIFINLISPSGVIGPTILPLLNNVNRLVYRNKVYYVTEKTPTFKRYTSKNEEERLNIINVNLETGVYEVTTSVNQVLQNHINNTDIHVTPQDKERWNNKVDASAVLIEGTNYNLVLSKD